MFFKLLTKFYIIVRVIDLQNTYYVTILENVWDNQQG